MSDEPKDSKQPYAKPELVEYGSVAKLTAAKSGPIKDGNSGMVMEHGSGGRGGDMGRK